VASSPNELRSKTMTDEIQDEPAQDDDVAQGPVTTEQQSAAADSQEAEAGHVLDLPDIEVVDEFSEQEAPQAEQPAAEATTKEGVGVGADELAELLAHEPPSDAEDAADGDAAVEAEAFDATEADEAETIEQEDAPDAAAPEAQADAVAPPANTEQATEQDAEAEAAAAADPADDAEPAANSEPIPTALQETDQGLTNAQLDKVNEFLDELKGTLVELVQQQPAPQPTDLGPLVEALQQGFGHSAAHAEATSTALTSIGERVAALTDQVERVAARKPQPTSRRVVATPAAKQRDATQGLQTAVITAVVLIVLGWSLLFWIKADSPRLALGTLIGANAIACCMLLSQRGRS